MKVKYRVEGLDCPNCAAKLEGMLNAEAEILSAKINFLTEKITVESELSEEALDALVARVATAFRKGTVTERL